MANVDCLQPGTTGAVTSDVTLFKKLLVGRMFVMLNLEVTSNC